jgi:hypothetical protein
MMMHIGRMHEEGRRGKALEFWHAISAIIRSKVNVTGTPQDYWDLTRAFRGAGTCASSSIDRSAGFMSSGAIM